MKGKRMNIDSKLINNYLDNNFFDIDIYSTLPSTNSFLKSKANEEKEGKVVIALCQSAGRGRLDRSFISEIGGIYLSILVKPKMEVSKSLVLTVISGLSVVDGIKKATNKETKIKWVNDIYYEDKKLAGILAEGSSNDSSSLDYLIVGIGINVNTPKKGFPEAISKIATSLYNEEKADYNKIIAFVLNEFYHNYLNINNQVINKSFLDKYKKYSCVIGKKVISYNLITNESMEVEVIDIDNNYGLVVKDNDGNIKTLTSGEVRLKI